MSEDSIEPVVTTVGVAAFPAALPTTSSTTSRPGGRWLGWRDGKRFEVTADFCHERDRVEPMPGD